MKTDQEGTTRKMWKPVIKLLLIIFRVGFPLQTLSNERVSITEACKDKAKAENLNDINLYSRQLPIETIWESTESVQLKELSQARVYVGKKKKVRKWRRNDGWWEINFIYPRILNQLKDETEPQGATGNTSPKISSEYEVWKVEDRMTTFRKASILSSDSMWNNGNK